MMGQTQIQAGSLRRSELFTVTRHVEPLNCERGQGEICYPRLPCSMSVSYALCIVNILGISHSNIYISWLLI